MTPGEGTKFEYFETRRRNVHALRARRGGERGREGCGGQLAPAGLVSRPRARRIRRIVGQLLVPLSVGGGCRRPCATCSTRKGSSTRRSRRGWSSRRTFRRTSRCGRATGSPGSFPSFPRARASIRCRRSPALYTVKFSRLGENMLTVKYGDGRWATLEFFVTEPLETVIKKRAAFLVNRHQHTDPSKWYAGMFSDWDQKNEIRRSPEDRDGLSAWLTDANDDAGMRGRRSSPRRTSSFRIRRRSTASSCTSASTSGAGCR